MRRIYVARNQTVSFISTSKLYILKRNQTEIWIQISQSTFLGRNASFRYLQHTCNYSTLTFQLICFVLLFIQKYLSNFSIANVIWILPTKTSEFKPKRDTVRYRYHSRLSIYGKTWTTTRSSMGKKMWHMLKYYWKLQLKFSRQFEQRNRRRLRFTSWYQ